MVLKADVMANPLANTIGHQGYIEPEKEVMHQVVTFLTRKVSDFSVTPADEPVLSLTGFPVVALPHMDHDAASTPGQLKVWQEKIRQREADLKARGCCHDALSVLQKSAHAPHLRYLSENVSSAITSAPILSARRRSAPLKPSTRFVVSGGESAACRPGRSHPQHPLKCRAATARHTAH
jgi:hypothetical protein